MRKISCYYNEYFSLSDSEKVSDKKLYAQLTVRTFIILICLFCIAFTSVALFSVSADNDITIPYVDLKATVTDDFGNFINPVSHPTALEQGFALKADTSYTVTLSFGDKNEAETFYCSIILISNSASPSYYTAQVFDNSFLSFTLSVTEDCTLSIEPKLGINTFHNSDDAIISGDVINI